MKLLYTAAAIMVASLSTSASAAPVMNSNWAGVNDDGGLGGSFAFLNSAGVDPLTLNNAWTTHWTPTNVVYSASFDSGNYSNAGSWDGSSSIYSFGSPDTSTYGETFFAPSSTLTGFDFLINNSGAGNQAKFVVAAFDGSKAVGPALYSQRVTLGGTGFTKTSIKPFSVSLNKGSHYVAYLTTAGVATPEPATWAMMVIGFGLVGAGMRRRETMQVRYAA